jgi:hypothetical protein
MIVDIELIEPQAAIFRAAASYNLIFGAQGSGKSHNIGILSGLFIIYCPNIVGLMAANTYDQLSRATLLRSFDVWQKHFGWTEYDPKSNPNGDYVMDKEPPAHFTPHGYTLKSNNNNIYFKNGAVVFTASLEKYKAIEGIEVGWAMLDETADTREEALKEVITARLRQKGLFASKDPNAWFKFRRSGDKDADENRAVNPLFIFTKPAKAYWISGMFDLERYRDEIIAKVYSETDYFYACDGVRQIVCYSVFHNRRNLPAGYIENRLKLLQGSGLIGSHFYGDPFAKTGEEFVTAFDLAVHVDSTAEAIPGEPIHFAIDFNAKPYMSGLCTHIVETAEEIEVIVFDEYANASPRNTAGHLADDLISDYEDMLMFGFFVYGDASGNNSIPVRGATSYFNDFTISIPSHLVYELRVPRQNPQYKAALGPGTLGRRAFLNALFSGAKKVRFRIHPRCKNLIADLTHCKEDVNGRMAKPKKDGVEERGHHLDALQYLVCHPKALGWLAKINNDEV